MPLSKDYNFVTMLSAASRGTAAVLHQFSLSFHENNDIFFLFFEGKDDPQIYLPFVRKKISNDDFDQYICEGKKTVLEVRERIKKWGREAKCLFFVDRDYDDFFDEQASDDGHTYITGFYSIENYVATIETVQLLCTDHANLSCKCNGYKAVSRNYKIGSAQFYRKLQPFIAWGLAMRESGEKPNWGNVKMRDIIAFDGCYHTKKSPNAFGCFRKGIGADGVNVGLSSIKKWIKILRETDPKIWVRGKYDLWYFDHFLLSSLEEERKKNNKIIIPYFVKNKKSLEIVSGQVALDKALHTFLSKKLK